MSASWSRVTAALVIGTVVLSGLLLGPRPAAADTQPPVPTTPVTVSTDPLPTVQINGVVWAQIVVGNTVYATGQFTQARPAGAAPGTNQTPRSNILAYNITNGQLVTGFAPTLNAQGLALVASPDGQTIYVGGDFTQVNGQNKYRLAALDATTGALRNFTPGMDSRVRALAINGTTLYVGGIFGTAANQPRTRLAAFNTTTSQLLPWAPSANAEVSTLAVHPGTNKVFVGGKFGTVNGQVYRGVGALDGTSGAVLPFPLNTVAVNSGTAAGYYGLKVAGDVVYGAGWSFSGAQGNFENVFAVNATTAQTIWLSGCRGDTYDAQPLGDVVYFVSHAHNCTSIGAFPETGGGNQQRGAAYRLAPVPGKVNSGIFPGQPAPELLHWFPTLAAGTYTGQTQAAWSVTGNAQYIALGGEFPTINNSVAQQGLVRYAIRTIAPNDDGPQGFSTITPTLTGLGGGAVRAAFTAAWDRDNTRLTYDLMRGANFESAVVAASATADTNFWTRPAMTLTDASAPAGSQTYRIRVTDPLGNVMVGQTAVINVPGGAGQTPYQARVAQDGAVNQWTLGETSGSTAFDRRGGRDLTLPAGAQRNQASALAGQTDPSTVFPGNANAGTGGAAVAGPQTFSVEAWFRAGPGTRGKIIGFGNAATGSSGSYDRHLYMNNAGNLVFGIYDGAVKVVTSPNAYTNGGFHHAVGTFTANQVQLFVDGVLVGSRTDAPSAQQYNGFWRVGGDNLSSWPTAPSGSSWNNLLDEVAVYPTALSAQTVLEHYNLGRGTPLNQAPTASFTATPNDLTVAVNAAASTDQDGTIAGYAWNFGDGQTGTGVSTQHTYAAAGNYTITLTVTDDDNATGTTTRPVTVTAPPAGAVTVAADAFDRTVAAGLGTADTGGAWTVAGAGTTTSVTGGAGRLGLPVGRTATMRLNSVATQDTDMTSTLWSETMPTGGGLYLGQSVRIGAGNEYLGRVRIMSSGVVQVSINRIVGGTETTIGASVNVAGLTYTAGQQLRVRTQAVGTAPTTVRVKVWPAGAAEPAAFQQSATDTTAGLQGPGAVGLYSYLSSSATAAGVVRFDDLTAVRPAAG